MRLLIRQIQQDLGLTTIFVTHDQEEAVSMADRIYLFLDGQIAQEGVAKDFYTRPASVDVATFFGTQNLISGEARSDSFYGSFGEVRLPDVFDVRNAKLVVRQEAIEIDTMGINSFEGRIEEAGYLGTHATATARLGSDLLRVSTAPHKVFEAGQSVRLTLPPERLWIVDDVGRQ